MTRVFVFVGCVAGIAITLGCGSSQETNECSGSSEAPHWKRLAAPENLRLSRFGTQTAVWNRGALWLFGQDGGAIWDIATDEWTPMSGFPGNLDEPRVALVDEQLLVFGAFVPGQERGSDFQTERTGWRFTDEAGWRSMALAPDWLFRAYRSAGSKRYFYAFHNSMPPRLALYDPTADEWQESQLPDAITQLPGISTYCVAERGWFGGMGNVTFFDEATLTWTATTTRSIASPVCLSEHVLTWTSSGAHRFAFGENRWVPVAGGPKHSLSTLLPAGRWAALTPSETASPPPGSLDSGWSLYDPDADEWTDVPRQCEPNWPRHFHVATDYGLLVWKLATEEDPYGEGRLLVLPDSKPLPER